MHFLSLIFGHRCHFHDWWIDGRTRVKATTDYHPPRATDAVHCLNTALDKWKTWPDRQRTVALNVLYLHARESIHEFDWERFQNAYIVADAVFALARDTGRLKTPKAVLHKDRFKVLCDTFQIPSDQSRFDVFVRLRNDFIHEAVWDNRMPGESRSEESFRASYWLYNFSRRAILAVFGLNGEYIRSPWWGLGSWAFDVT